MKIIIKLPGENIELNGNQRPVTFIDDFGNEFRIHFNTQDGGIVVNKADEPLNITPSVSNEIRIK